MGGGDVELCGLLSLLEGGSGGKLGAYSEHRKYQGDQKWIGLILFWSRERPEMLVIGVEGLSMDHRVDGINTLEIHFQEDIGLELHRQNRYHLCQPTLAGPVVSKRMLGSNAENIGGARVRIGHVRE